MAELVCGTIEEDMMKPLVSEMSHPDLPQLPKPGDEILGTLFGAMHNILWDLEHGRERDILRDYVTDVIRRTGQAGR